MTKYFETKRSDNFVFFHFIEDLYEENDEMGKIRYVGFIVRF